MALYKYASYLAVSQDASFDQLYNPGTLTPFAGIFRCSGCGREIVSEHPKPLPSQNHHQHFPNQGPILWRMIVWADHNMKSVP
jgi:hypothetical protein